MGLAHDLAPEGECHDKQSEANTGWISYRHADPDGQWRGQTDRVPEASLRCPGEGSVHRSDRKDRARGGHDRGFRAAVERRHGRMEADPGVIARVCDGHGRQVQAGPQCGRDLPQGARGPVLWRSDRWCEGLLPKILEDYHLQSAIYTLRNSYSRRRQLD